MLNRTRISSANYPAARLFFGCSAHTAFSVPASRMRSYKFACPVGHQHNDSMQSLRDSATQCWTGPVERFYTVIYFMF